MRSLILMCLLLAIALTDVAAQDALPLAPGDRVRVTVPGSRGVYTLVAIEAETLLIADSKAQDSRGVPLHLKVPLAGVERLQVSRGREPRLTSTFRGAAYGGAAGVVLGAIVGFASYEPCSADTSLCIGPNSAGVGALAGAVVFGGAGLLVGGLIGALTPGERWEPVSLADRPEVFLNPDGRLVLAARIDF